ncbi:general transcription factor [Cyclospora cayetanensis]|uniref:General transcription factor n=1 Tax=Cyclospora cayetanensis TaxID=88456 RepID=A0A1D3DA16_9EIME|nr:general transcription factor [Cyclospora cayetanensis]
MATSPPPSHISMGAAAFDRGVPSSAADSAARGGVSKPYDRELFLAFMSATTRLFCDDEQIVIADFLAHEEKAYTERDLIDRLGWPDKRVERNNPELELSACTLCALKRARSLSEVGISEVSRGVCVGESVCVPSCSTAGSNTESSRAPLPGGAALLGSTAPTAAPFYYRVSPYAVAVVQYRIEHLDARLKQQRLEAESRDVFACPLCGRQWDALDAQRLRLDPEDATFLCECGAKLEHEDSKAVVEQLASLQRRCQEQLQLLRSLISRCWAMRVPVFPPFTRADKHEFKKQQDRIRQTAGSSVGSAASGGSDSQPNASGWRQSGRLSGDGRKGAWPAEGVKRATPVWLRSGGGSVSSVPPLSSNSSAAGFQTAPSLPAVTDIPAQPAGGALEGSNVLLGRAAPLRMKPRESASGSSPEASERLEEAPGAAVAEEAPRVFIARLGRDFTLEEAVEYQLEMSIEEHEGSHTSMCHACLRLPQKFMELQSTYLDDLAADICHVAATVTAALRSSMCLGVGVALHVLRCMCPPCCRSKAEPYQNFLPDILTSYSYV